MPVPICVTRPVPLITPANVSVSLRLNDQRAVVDDVAGDAAGGAAVAELQRAGADRRAAGIGVVGR